MQFIVWAVVEGHPKRRPGWQTGQTARALQAQFPAVIQVDRARIHAHFSHSFITMLGTKLVMLR